MKELGEVFTEQGGLGRQAIADRCIAHGNAVSEHEVREILRKLEQMGLAEIRTGRGGTKLTETGYLKYRQILHGEIEEKDVFRK